MALSEKKKRAACRMYYLDIKSIADIAKELQISREAVRDAIDDPGEQAAYLKTAERVRKRTRLRAAAAAEAALERQIEFVMQTDVSDELRSAQMLTAERMLRRSLDQDTGQPVDARIVVEGIEIGMPEKDMGLVKRRRVYRRSRRSRKQEQRKSGWI